VTLLNLDSVAGRANRWIARRAKTILTSVACDIPGAEDPIGVPLRRAVLADAEQSESRRRLGLDPDRKTLLVTGASQGARSLNVFMGGFLNAHADALADWQVMHLTGSGTDCDQLRAAYLNAGVKAQVLEFLNSMGDAWGAADLALSRGGASSLAELAANTVPALIAPYPWHADQHQAVNARDLVALGGVVLVKDTIELSSNLNSIGTSLQTLLQDSAQRTSMREALESLPTQDAAMEISKRLLGLT
jgi:UDP-N-acetylglucosamine--N-acetylmuramyl-(pentapeptide) pyrophosphoryl-undecaprenol N-acetylglucosamine transferase